MMITFSILSLLSYTYTTCKSPQKSIFVCGCHRYHTRRPLFEFTDHGDGFVCKLTLPSSDVLPPLVGPKVRSKQKAKQLVCLDACKQLHLLGALDDCLCPRVEEPSMGTVNKANACTSSSVAGT